MSPPRGERGASGSGQVLASSRYELLVKLAAGGMGTVYVGRLRGASGFTRLVAIKRPFRHLFEQPGFKRMLIEEARIASHLHHPNAVAVQDVEELGGVLHLVMDYVEGASLASLHAAGDRLPPRVAIRIALDAAAGLQAAHELTDENGEPLSIVHRDVSPHNLLVGLDGVTRLSDFGIAKFSRSQVKTTAGSLKGKIGYMPPEYLDGDTFDARGDVFALAVVTWEALAGVRLFKTDNDVESLRMIVERDAPPISSVAPELAELDDVLAMALARKPDERFVSAAAFASALETAARRTDRIGRHVEVASVVRERLGAALADRRARIGAPLDAPSTTSDGSLGARVDTEAAAATGSLEGSHLPVRDESVPPPAKRSRLLLFAGALAALVGGGVLALVVLAPRAPAPASSAAPSAPPAASEATKGGESSNAVAPPVASATEAAEPPVPIATPKPAVRAPSRPAARSGSPRPSATPKSDADRVAPNPY